MKTRSALAAIVFVCGGLSISAQQAPPDPRPAFRSGVELVTLDVGVVDKQGQPLRGLAPGDFTVTVNGARRRVVSAEFIDTQRALASGNQVADVVPVSSNDGAGIGRLFVFVVDQSTLDAGHLRNVANAANRFLSKLTFADRSAMMVLPVGPNVGFTWAGLVYMQSARSDSSASIPRRRSAVTDAAGPQVYGVVWRQTSPGSICVVRCANRGRTRAGQRNGMTE